MEEDHTFKTPCSIKTVTEAFSVSLQSMLLPDQGYNIIPYQL